MHPGLTHAAPVLGRLRCSPCTWIATAFTAGRCDRFIPRSLFGRVPNPYHVDGLWERGGTSGVPGLPVSLWIFRPDRHISPPT